MKLQPQKPSSAGLSKKEVKDRNYVHDNIIRAENIKKESHHLQKNKNENFQLNPYNCTLKLMEFILTTKSQLKSTHGI
jgi:hypothetical protein